MRILLIHNFSKDFNGEDAYFLSQVDLFKIKNHKLVVYSRSNKNIRNDPHHKLKIIRELFTGEYVNKELSKIIKKFKPDLAHVHNVYPLITPTVYQVLKDSGICTVQTIHNYRFLCPKSILFRNGRLCELCVNKKFHYPAVFYGCYHRSKLASLMFDSSLFYHKNKGSFDSIDKFIFPSEFTRKYYINNLDIDLNKTAVIPYFVDSHIMSSNRQKKYFLFVGRLSEEKGILGLLKLFSSLPSYKFVVIGDGPLRNEVEEFKKYKNIIIKGFIPHNKVQNYFNEAICTIIPSQWYEVLPMVLLESFAKETPVIVPRFGTFPDIVQEGKTGLFYKQYNFDDLKEKILWAWEHKDKMKEMGEEARRDYEKKYTPAKHYQALMKVYKSLMR